MGWNIKRFYPRFSETLNIYNKFLNKENIFPEIDKSKDILCNLKTKMFELKGLFEKLANKNNYTNSNESINNNYLSVRVNLPKLQLLTFLVTPWSGKSFGILMFRLYIAKIFQMYKNITVVKDSAYKSIEGISVTNENYKLAIDILLKRFGESRVIRRALHTELRKIPSSSPKIQDLRWTLESIDKIMQATKKSRRGCR